MAVFSAPFQYETYRFQTFPMRATSGAQIERQSRFTRARSPGARKSSRTFCQWTRSALFSSARAVEVW